jgi:uncharacterized protein YcbX
MSVLHLWRYAVKGLDRDELASVHLSTNAGFPNDRRWAMRYADDIAGEDVDSGLTNANDWVHKSKFLCAYTAPVLLGLYETNYDDDTDTLIVKSREDGKELLVSRLTDVEDRVKAEKFFSEANGGRALEIVAKEVDDAAAKPRHHYGNTPMGFKYHPSGSILHLVNVETVSDLSLAMTKGNASTDQPLPLHPSRFRPNIVFDGFPAWHEFNWVGKQIVIGSEVVLEVVGRAVRCEATNVDARHGSGNVDHDIPKALSKYFPQHGPYLGVYARVVKGGTIRAGDCIQVGIGMNVRLPFVGMKDWQTWLVVGIAICWFWKCAQL